VIDMGIIAPSTSVSSRQKRIVFQNPGPPVPDGDGGFSQSWIDLPPAAYAQVSKATQQSLERITSGAILSTASYVVTAPYRVGVTTKSRIIFDGRVLNVLDVTDEDERHVELKISCAEVVP